MNKSQSFSAFASSVGMKKPAFATGSAQARQGMSMLYPSSKTPSSSSSSKRGGSRTSKSSSQSSSSNSNSNISLPMPKSSSMSSIKKNVSFDGQVRAKRGLHINDYSAREVNATWYDASELGRIRGEVKSTLEVMKKHHQGCMDSSAHSHRSNASSAPSSVIDESEEFENSDHFHEDTSAEFCVRGLEKWSSDALVEKKRRQRKAATAVLAEQKRQRELGLHDDERLSEAYRQHSLASQVIAVKDGAKDLDEVKEVYRSLSNEALSQLMVNPELQKKILVLLK